MERGLLLDVGRKFWSIDEIKQLIELMAKVGLTHLQLHLSENEAFRLNLKAVSTDRMSSVNDRTYSYDDIQEILKFAHRYKIQVIPDIDAPGHLRALLKNRQEFALPETEGCALDVTNSLACEWFLSIIRECCEWFSECDIFHIGGDEFIDFRRMEDYPYLLSKSREYYGEKASGLEFYVDFVNHIAQYLSLKGKKVRVWNDGFLRKDLESLSVLTKDVEVCYWTNWDVNMALVEDWLHEGYRLVNFCDNDLYYVLGENAGYNYPSVEKLVKFADRNKFSGGQILTNEEMKSVSGTYFSVWADKAEAKSVSEILNDLAELLPIFVKKYGEI